MAKSKISISSVKIVERSLLSGMGRCPQCGEWNTLAEEDY